VLVFVQAAEGAEVDHGARVTPVKAHGASLAVLVGQLEANKACCAAT
jgi:hypothetical protein